MGSGNLKAKDKAVKDLEKRLRDIEEENAIFLTADKIVWNQMKKRIHK